MGRRDVEFEKDMEQKECGRCGKRKAAIGNNLCEQCEDEYIAELNKRRYGHA